MLSIIQKDVLIEILNTNIGLAASQLSEMVNQKIILSVPQLDLTKGNEIDMDMFLKNTIDFRTSVLSIIKFGQNISGNAYVIFPADKAKDLVNACTGEDSASGLNNNELNEDDIDVIKEISNIIVNSLIGEFGNLLHVRLDFTFPHTELALVDSVTNTIFPEDIHFISMYTTFLLSDSNVKGMIFIALSVDSEKMLIDKINEMLDEIDG